MIAMGSLKFAQDRVSEFAHEVMASHEEAMECRDCETLLQLGIDAFNWLMLVDRQVREGMFQHRLPFDPAMDRVIKTLCRDWLKPCEFAEQRVAALIASGFQIDNLATFRDCCVEMAAIVEACDEPQGGALAEPLTDLRDAAVREHHDGQTAEFI